MILRNNICSGVPKFQFFLALSKKISRKEKKNRSTWKPLYSRVLRILRISFICDLLKIRFKYLGKLQIQNVKIFLLWNVQRELRFLMVQNLLCYYPSSHLANDGIVSYDVMFEIFYVSTSVGPGNFKTYCDVGGLFSLYTINLGFSK